MSEYCVLVVDAAKARFFTLEPVDTPEMETGPVLNECNLDLADPEGEAAGKEIWTDAKSGNYKGPQGSPGHNYDDHRDRHREEQYHRFAQVVADQALKLAAAQQARFLVIASDKHMLGNLRDVLRVPPKSGIEIREVAKNLTKLSPREIHNHLATEGVLPEAKGPITGTWTTEPRKP